MLTDNTQLIFLIEIIVYFYATGNLLLAGQKPPSYVRRGQRAQNENFKTKQNKTKKNQTKTKEAKNKSKTNQ